MAKTKTKTARTSDQQALARPRAEGAPCTAAGKAGERSYTNKNAERGKGTQPSERPKLAICNDLDGSRKYDAKGNKSEKDKDHMISFVCGI